MPKPFDYVALQRQVDAALSDVPDDHSRCLVGYALTDGRWRVSMAQRLGHGWRLDGYFGKDSAEGNISGGIMLKGSWP